MAKVKLTVEQAAVKAFQACRLNHDKSKSVCKYLIVQNLISSGYAPSEASSMLTPEVEAMVMEWYSQREVNPMFIPSIEPKQS